MAHAPCGCLIWSSSAYTGSEVALSLSQRIILPFGKGEAVFRFYEPRTLLPLMASLTDEERRQFLPLITHVKWFQKQWLGADIRTSENANINPHSRWELTQEQVSSMQNIAQQM